jgi:PKHD-type hydroxylase
MRDQQWLFFKATLTDPYVDELIRHMEKTYTPIDASVGFKEEAKNKSDIRVSEVRWIDVNREKTMSDMLWTYINRANRDSFDVDVRYLNEVQYTTYDGDKQAHYDWHHDVDFKNNQPYHRKLSLTLQLSNPDEYEGGDFEFDGDIDQLPPEYKEKGTILIFPSFYRHRVSPVTQGTRKALVAWFEGPHWR